MALAAAIVLYGAATRAAEPPQAPTAEERKDELVRQLAVCESGGSGASDKPIVGGGGAYLGRFQFTVRAVITYVQQRDGRTLSAAEATALAHDYEQAAELAKYVIFVRGEVGQWPGCGARIGLAKNVAAIKAM